VKSVRKDWHVVLEHVRFRSTHFRSDAAGDDFGEEIDFLKIVVYNIVAATLRDFIRNIGRTCLP